MAAEWRPPENLQGSQVALAKAKPKVRVQFCFEKTERDKQPEAAARPKLHIDDGCMGGGTSVPMQTVDHITWTTQSGDYNDIWDYKTNHFDSSSRSGIFHYTLFCKMAKLYYRGEWYLNPGGAGSQPGNTFLVTEKYSYSNEKIAGVFMHELGHNMNLDHSQEKDGSDSNPSVNPTGSETVKDTVMYWKAKDVNRVDYLQQEWGAIDLTYV